MSRARLSVCMMVRDAAATLEAALRSVHGWADELVIIDTGSTDGTQAIARIYADRYDERPWPNDFGKARNWTLDLATGDFALILDADEYVEDPGTAFPRIRGKLAKGAEALELSVVNVVDSDSDGRPTLSDSFRQLRVIPLDPSVRYAERVHNDARASVRTYLDRTGGRWLYVPARIIHTGYDLDFEACRKKYGPRLSMYAQREAEAVSTFDVNEARYFHGVGLYIAGYPLAALRKLDECDEALFQTEYQKIHLHSVKVKAHLTMMSRREVFNPVAVARDAAVAVARYPTPEIRVTAAQIALGLGQRKEALMLFFRAYEEADQGARQVSRRALLRPILDIMRQMGNDDEAARLSEMPEAQAAYVIGAMREHLESLDQRPTLTTEAA